MRVFVAVAVSVFAFVFVPVFAHPYPFSHLPSSNTRASHDGSPKNTSKIAKWLPGMQKETAKGRSKNTVWIFF